MSDNMTTLDNITMEEKWQLAEELLATGLFVEEVARFIPACTTAFLRAEIRRRGGLRRLLPNRPHPRSFDRVHSAVSTRYAQIMDEDESYQDPVKWYSSLKLKMWLLENRNVGQTVTVSRRERVVVVAKLHSLGMSAKNIACTAKLDAFRVKMDVRRLGGKVFDRDSFGKPKTKTFQAVLREYALVMLERYKPDGIENVGWYLGILAEYLDVWRTIGYLEGVASLVFTLKEVGVKEEDRPRRQLYLLACRQEDGGHAVTQDISPMERVSKVWREYLRSVVDGSCGDLPFSKEDLSWTLRDILAADVRDSVCGMWDEKATRLVDSALAQIPSKHRKFLVWYFIDRRSVLPSFPRKMEWNRWTMEWTHERFRKTEFDALHLIAQQPGFQRLRAYLSPMGQVRKDLLEALERIDQLNKPIPG